MLFIEYLLVPQETSVVRHRVQEPGSQAPGGLKRPHNNTVNSSSGLEHSKGSGCIKDSSNTYHEISYLNILEY